MFKLAYTLGSYGALIKLGVTVEQRALTPEQKAFMDRLTERGSSIPKGVPGVPTLEKVPGVGDWMSPGQQSRQFGAAPAAERVLLGRGGEPFVGGWGEYGGPRVPGHPSAVSSPELVLGERAMIARQQAELPSERRRILPENPRMKQEVREFMEWRKAQEAAKDRLATARSAAWNERMAREGMISAKQPITLGLERGYGKGLIAHNKMIEKAEAAQRALSDMPTNVGATPGTVAAAPEAATANLKAPQWEVPTRGATDAARQLEVMRTPTRISQMAPALEATQRVVGKPSWLKSLGSAATRLIR